MSQFASPTGFFGKILAKGMARSHKHFYKNAMEVIDPKKVDRYLEIGFGSGIFIKKYMSHVAKISGIDHSQDMVQLASTINKDLVDAGKAEFKQGNASLLPWKDNEFTVVAAIETFFFLNEVEKTLNEIFRVLQPGGRVVIEMAYNKDDGVDHQRHIKKMNLRLYSGEEMKKLLTKAGFSDIVISYYTAFWIPIKGYIVPKGMVIKAVKKIKVSSAL
jgi:ubiquinone/menaquinone biosynthesis C-methylase UbiE